MGMAFAQVDRNMRPEKAAMNLMLQEVVTRYCPIVAGTVENLDDLVLLTQQQLFDLSQAVGDELCRTGFDEDDEPTQRGLMLESLLDEVTRTSRKKN
jgi:hypothetical protein